MPKTKKPSTKNATKSDKRAAIKTLIAQKKTQLHENQTKKRKQKKYRSFRLQKKLNSDRKPIPTTRALIRSSFNFIWQQRRLFGALLLIYAVAYFVLLRSPVQNSIADIQASLQNTLGAQSTEGLGGALNTLGVFAANGGSGQSSSLIGFSILVMSLVYIWATRQLLADQKIIARDAFYNALSPLLSTVVILVVLSLQLVPFAILSYIYGIARSNGLFVTGMEDLGFFTAALLAGILSLYWMTSSVIAFYIVTLPGTYPLQALRAARKLVQFRRRTVFSRLLGFPLLIGIVYFFILLFVIRFLPNQAVFANDVLFLLVLPLVHVYLYKLYRSLL